MAGGVDAIGTAVEGVAYGAALEDMRPGDAGTYGSRPVHDCLNCGAALTGPYCAACGQSAHVHRTLTSIGHDLLHGVFHFEGRIWHTLPLLAWKPGELTRRYIEGQRVRFVSPMALFLFSIFLMFAVVASVSGGTGERNMGTANQKIAARIAADRQKLATPNINAAERAKAQEELDDLNDVRTGLHDDPVQMSLGNGQTQSPLGTSIRAMIGHFRNNPDLALYKLQSYGYKYAWLLIVLSLPIMVVATLGVRGVRLYDHAIFVIYSISFMAILLVIVSLLAVIDPISGLIPLVILLVPPIHMARQMKGAYALSWPSAIARTVVLLVGTFIVLTCYVLILLALGLLH